MAPPLGLVHSCLFVVVVVVQIPPEWFLAEHHPANTNWGLLSDLERE